VNPMLGHRGARLCVTYPEILEMQVTAIISAAVEVAKKGKKVYPEIMIPLTMSSREFDSLETRIRSVAEPIIKAAKSKVRYLVGTMSEVPRAALLADQIAQKAEFFSFGTNDLTQMTFGLSRDDAGRFLPAYVDENKAGLLKHDPFQVLDKQGVGKLIKIGIEGGRATRPGIKIGVCGEHGGEQNSVKFCCSLGMNYVSCSPYRVPIARLSCAQYEVEQRNATAKKPAKKAAPKKAAAKKAVKKPAKKAAKKK
ncbi:MAG: hypothetical protein LUH04_10725, partial [Clostridium sp.]|nr:hypothetical protein [Clostridium sp.]